MAFDHLSIHPIATVSRKSPRPVEPQLLTEATPARLEGSLREKVFESTAAYKLDVYLYPIGTTAPSDRQVAFTEWLRRHEGEILSDDCRDTHAALRIRVLGSVVSLLLTEWSSITISPPPVLRTQDS